MRGFKFAKVLVGKNLIKDAVGVPRRTATHELAISRSKRIENGIVEILIISHEIKLIRVNHIKGWTSDGFRIVWESLNAASVNKIDFRFLWLENNSCWKLMSECCYARYDSFCLTPRGTHNSDRSFWMCNRIF